MSAMSFDAVALVKNIGNIGPFCNYRPNFRNIGITGIIGRMGGLCSIQVIS
jgi:hypothetical protein